MSTATARSVFKLGELDSQNREIMTVESGSTYDLSWASLTDYTDAAGVQFPYIAP